MNESRRVILALVVVSITLRMARCLKPVICEGVDNGCCTKETPCYENDGDCDNDSECMDGLVCSNNNCAWGENDDCCMKIGYRIKDTKENDDEYSPPETGCFPGESLVILDKGEKKSMKELRIGETILTVEHGKLVPTRVLGFLDKKINQTTDYLNLILENNRSLFISPRHVMFIAIKDKITQSILAKDISLDDMVIVEDEEKIGIVRIRDIKVEKKMGAYVPLTNSGTLLVDGVLVSSYTNTDHWLAHIALSPLRWWPTLLLDNEMSQDMEGMRTFPHLVRELGSILGLVTMADGGTDTVDILNLETSQLAMEKMDKIEF